MGIRASYLATGGILTVLGLILGQAILGWLGGFAATVGAFLLTAMALFFKAVLVVVVIWMVLRVIRGRKGEPANA